MAMTDQNSHMNSSVSFDHSPLNSPRLFIVQHFPPPEMQQLILIFRICLPASLPHVWSFLVSSLDHINIFIRGQRWPFPVLFHSHCNCNCLVLQLACTQKQKRTSSGTGQWTFAPFDLTKNHWLGLAFNRYSLGLCKWRGIEMSFCQIRLNILFWTIQSQLTVWFLRKYCNIKCDMFG